MQVSGNEVAGSRKLAGAGVHAARSANGVAGGIRNQHARTAVGQRRCAGSVGDDLVALNRRAALAGALKVVDGLDFGPGQGAIVDCDLVDEAGERRADSRPGWM